VSIYPHGEVMEYEDAARDIARAVLRALDVVGLICIEFFLTRDGRLLVNEIAPRPHNSGHLTIDAVRAVCGLPLGSFTMTTPAAAMANLLGDLWQTGEPRWERILAHQQLRLHLYGKTEPRPGRKMGHLTAVARSAEEAAHLVRAARESLVAQ
jgi:5-(carboxyamino)imidazole ribonucleotide synthase